ncbi:MAG: family 10 glycosylhydrolase [Nannocystaceae bacterium]|nr:family 10 glycosylhydrolase [Nannocystaceae bacterium]
MTSVATAGSSTKLGTSGETGNIQPGELVEVAHEREFRGTWIATVFNINFPAAAGLAADVQQENLIAILDGVSDLGLNAVFLQVRPESDALYASDLEPWSRFLTGTQGQDPGYDPLEFAVAQAHARGLEVHAWINPYRAQVDADSSVSPLHVSQVLSEYALPYGDGVWMDPGSSEVRDHVVTVALDLADRYAIDGVQMDDYFYPYRTDGAFPDTTTWQAYQSSGGALDLSDWRRQNVNLLVESLHDELIGSNPSVRFGVAPFGIYRPGVPPGITGLDQYEVLYADPVLWIQEGWVDYLAPQLYWPIAQEQQAYDVLLEWWASLADGGRHIFAGNAAYRIGSEPGWTADELLDQVAISRESGPPSAGNIFYNVDSLLDDLDGAATSLAQDMYARPALTPPLPRLGNRQVAAPEVTSTPEGWVVSHPQRDQLRAFVVYRDDGSDFVVEEILGPNTMNVTLGGGRWAISAADRFGTESLGVVVE